MCFILFCSVFSFRFVLISNVAGTRRHESQTVTPLFLLSHCPSDRAARTARLMLSYPHRKALKAARAAVKAAEEEAKRLLLLQQVCLPQRNIISAASLTRVTVQRAQQEQIELERAAAQHADAAAQERAAAAGRETVKLASAAAAAQRSAAKETDKENALAVEDAGVSKSGGFSQQQVWRGVVSALGCAVVNLYQVYINWFLTLQQVKQGIVHASFDSQVFI